MLVTAAASPGLAAEPAVADRPDLTPRRPNILWITCEDISPHLGCYGDRRAVTPRLDQLASEGARYVHAFSIAGVCAPSRSCLITGMYPTSIGSQHMRSRAVLPPSIRCFPEYLRQAGYYCTNNVKTDYNFVHDPATWDESSPRAHWRNRKPAQPFFSVFNITVTHESKVRADDKEFAKLTAGLSPAQRQDPAKLELPPYYPDTPAVRRDWAHYYELITAMDARAGELLDELDADGLSSNTIVFFFSDHGVGLPRAKRWLYDSGIQVPLIIRWPGQIKPESVERRLVSFVDFAPTVLSLASVPIPEHLQGGAFLGSSAVEPRCYVYAARDRMDERYDIIRAVRDSRYKYIRNYEPQRPYAQFLSYAEVGPTMKEFRRLSAAGLLTDPPRLFMRNRKPPEELYDLENDPHEIHNLVRLPKYQEVLDRLRAAHVEWMRDTIDTGLLPEPDMIARAGKEGIYAAVRNPETPIPLDRLREVVASRARGPAERDKLIGWLKDPDAAVRYWAAVRLGQAEDDSPKEAPRNDSPKSEAGAPNAGGAEPSLPAVLQTLGPPLHAALGDSSPSVRVAAARSLVALGDSSAGLPVLVELLRGPDAAVRVLAASALDELGPKAAPALDALKDAQQDSNEYVVRLSTHAVRELNEAAPSP